MALPIVERSNVYGPPLVSISPPFANFEAVHRTIGSILSGIECVQSDYTENELCYRITYGTCPLFPTLTFEEKQCYERKKEIVDDMCLQMRITNLMGVSPFHFKKLGVTVNQLYTHMRVLSDVVDHWFSCNLEQGMELELEEQFTIENHYMGYPRRWSESVLSYYQYPDGTINIEMCRANGDRNSVAFIKRELIRQLTSENISQMQRQICFEKRASYLSLLGGVVDLDSVVDLEDSGSNNHISNYLLNFFVGIDICSYL